MITMMLSVMFIQGQVPASVYAETTDYAYVENLTAKTEDWILYMGGSDEFSTTDIYTSVKPEEADQDVVFKSLNNNVVSVDENGVVSAENYGIAMVKVTTEGKKENGRTVSKIVPITVLKFIHPRSIEIQGEDSVLATGESMEISAQVKPVIATDKSYYFESSDEAIATVSEDGVVKANNNGITGKVVISAVASSENKNGEIIVDSIEIEVVASDDDNTNEISQVGIHDPSIFQDPESGNYYSYGSHIVAAKSEDAVSWNYIANSDLSYSQENTLFDKWYVEEFKDIYKWLFSYSDEDIEAIKSGEKKGPEGIWAIDMTYSQEAKDAGNDPYLMYVTVCNSAWKSAIVLCTSDNPEGGFKYKDTIVCSDYTAEEVDAGNTNLLDVLGVSSTEEVRDMYGDYYFPNGFRSSGAQVPDCIDPAPYYDAEGNMYLAYGSFTCYGGIRIVKLDAKTGGRLSENYDYEVVNGEVMSDPYFGKKIANKYGEGPYVLPVKDTTGTSSTGYYYFLFYSEGNLNPYGGYNMRMLRSEYPDRDFVDYAGNSSLTTSVSQTNLGVRIIDNYKFSFMEYASMANGGNSALVNDDGRVIIQYHSKSNDGTYGFIVKNMEMFMNEDGWLVTAPCIYKNETINRVSADEIVGSYEFIYHRLTYTSTGSINGNYDYINSIVETLNADGTITGNYEGTWSYDESTNYINITIGDKLYKGIALEQRMDDENKTKTITFSALGTDNRAVWGSKIVKTDAEKAQYDMEKIELDEIVNDNFSLSNEGFFKSEITWTSDNDAIVIDGNEAKVTCQDYDTNVKLVATIKNGNTVLNKEFDVIVKAEEILIDTVVRTSYIYLPSETAAGKKITWSSSNSEVISADGTVVNPENGSVVVTLTGIIENSDKILSYEVTVLPTTVESYLYTENYEDVDDISTKWYSPNAQGSLSVGFDGEHGKYAMFAPGSANSRGAYSNFDSESEISGTYTIEFDTALTAGNNQETVFAVTGKDMVFTNNGANNGIDSGYILKLVSLNSTTWTINDGGETVTIPKDKWVHISATVSATTGKVSLTISDNETTYFEGRVNLSGSGNLNGLYVRGGRYNSVTCVDNIKVY